MRPEWLDWILRSAQNLAIDPKHLDVLEADPRWTLETFVLPPEEVAIATVK